MKQAVRFLQRISSPLLNRTVLRGRAALEQMADDIRVLAANAGSVVADDLELAGWAPAQIERHGKDAARHARALELRQ